MESLEGWVPRIGEDVTLEQVIEHAFDYRGNTTVVKQDGMELTGYVFNRNPNVAAPYIQMFDEAGAGPHTILYSEIATIKFSGKDTAAGARFEAWVERKEGGKAQSAAAPAGQRRDRDSDPDGG